MTEMRSRVTDAVPYVAGEVDAVADRVADVREAVGDFAAANGATGSLLAHIRLAVSEGAANVVHHAYPSGEDGCIHFAADLEDGTLEVVIADDGEGIQPGSSDAHGLGLGIVAAVSADFAIRQRLPHGTELWMSFLLDA
jgi:anti-sigma regulatory factor (Ser/Thr protein kinase)